MIKNVIWIVVVIAIIWGLYFLFTTGGVEVDPPYEAGVLHPLDHIKGLPAQLGDASSTVVVMEYSDFQCPACKTYYPIIRQIVQEFEGEIAFVYRHFPLTGLHPNAEFAARAAEAAGKQDKFWEMHDLLFEKQNEWATASDITTMFQAYATLLGLDVEKFNLDWRSKEVKDFVTAQRMHAVRSGLQGTPSFFVNGVQIQNPNSLDEFKQIIRSAIK